MSNNISLRTRSEITASRCVCLLLLLLLLGSSKAGQPQNSAPGKGEIKVSLSRGTDSAELGRQAKELLTLSARQNVENHPLALQTAQQALALYRTLPDNEGVASAYAQIGRCYMAQGDLPEAIQNYEQALQIWRERGNTAKQAGNLIMLGFIEVRKAEWPRAIELLTQAQNLIDEKEHPAQMGQIASALADIFNDSGIPEEGLVQYQRALDYYRQTPDTRDDQMIIAGLGSSYYLLGKYPEALAQFELALAGTVPDSLDAAHYRENLGRVYSAQGQYALALAHLQFALDVYTKANNPIEAAQVHGLIGQVYQQQGQFGRAREDYQKALTAFTSLSDRLNQAATYYALGRLEMKQGNYAAAEDYLQKSLTVTEDVRRVPTSRDLTTAFSATVHERYESYVACLMRKHQAQPGAGYAVKAFEISEQERGRALAELLRATHTNLAPGVEPGLAEQEKQLRQSLLVKEDEKIALLGKTYQKEELDGLDAQVTRLTAAYKQITETISARDPSYTQITQPTAWKLEQIQQQIVGDDDTVLLEYSLGDDHSYVWAVTRTGITSYDLPAEALISEAAESVYKLLEASPSISENKEGEEKLAKAVQGLGQLILAPLAAQLNKRRIIVVADGSLNYIPFQILPVSTEAGEPLVAVHEVINAPSASILGQLRQETARRPKAEKVLAAFGDPVFASNYAQRKDPAAEQLAAVQPPAGERWQSALRNVELKGDAVDASTIRPLIYAGPELASLRNVVSPSDTLVAAGFDATRERLQQTDLSKYSILHFATHGILDPKRPENSGIFLSMVDRNGRPQNGFLGLQDIYSLHAPVELVVLSACRTGLGKDVHGEGLISLTRGFMYAGASSVVASLWKVDDEATGELMKQFYINLLQKEMPPAAALRAAQNSIRQKPEWRSPHYWAAFTLQGEYRQSIKQRTTIYPKVIVGITLLVLFVCAWWYRGRLRRRGTDRSPAIRR